MRSWSRYYSAEKMGGLDKMLRSRCCGLPGNNWKTPVKSWKQVDAILREFVSYSPGHAWCQICYLESYPQDHPFGHINALRSRPGHLCVSFVAWEEIRSNLHIWQIELLHDLPDKLSEPFVPVHLYPDSSTRLGYTWFAYRAKVK